MSCPVVLSMFVTVIGLPTPQLTDLEGVQACSPSGHFQGRQLANFCYVINACSSKLLPVLLAWYSCTGACFLLA